MPPLPPSSGLTDGESVFFLLINRQQFLFVYPERYLSDLIEVTDAMTMAFPVTIHEQIAPGTEPNNLKGYGEAVHKHVPFKILKELKQAVQNCGVNSSFTLGIV